MVYPFSQVVRTGISSHGSTKEHKFLASVVNPLTVLPDLPLAPGQRLDVPHVDHGHREAPEEGLLAAGEAVDERRCGRPRRGQQFLVGLQEPAARLDVGVVVLVEAVGRGRLEVVERRAVAAGGAPLDEERPVAAVQRRVAAVRPAEVVQPVRHELALHAPERVRPCTGQEASSR
jgi:hypothetical protein